MQAGRPLQPAGPVSRIDTPGFAGHNVAWSPFFPDRLAVAGAANYGLVGNGRLHVIGTHATPASPVPQMSLMKAYDTQDGLYDVAWSELNEHQLATASGDGSIKLWDTSLADHPIRNWHEHTREVFSVDWNNIKKDTFASSSWDASVKVWHPERPRSLATITAHTACVYAAIWSPHAPDILATASGDGHARLFDLRTTATSHAVAGAQPIATIPVGGEVLALDWNKYRQFHLATGSTDKSVKLWDLRAVSSNPSAAAMPPPGAAGVNAGPPAGQITAICTGHDYAVRKVAFSPHSPSLLASASYDMTARIWDVDHPSASLPSVASRLGGGAPAGQSGALRSVHNAHTEFVVGVGWSLFQEGLVASTAWDMSVHLWTAH
ncbi:unnamed protein product [Parajaminaea phylloscopi]